MSHPDEDAAAIESVTSHLEAGRRALEIPGVSFALMRDGRVVHTDGLGEAVLGSAQAPGSDSVFRIASMTKSFTASAVLLLRDRGALRLDDPLEQHCPWAAGIGTPAGSWPITLRDLVVMQAGLPTDDPWGDRQESLPIADFDELVRRGLSFTRPPRTRFEYSNAGYALLGRVVSEVSGTDYREFVRRELLAPLGMASTSFEASAGVSARVVQGYAPGTGGLVPEPLAGPGAFSAMGGLLSTVLDISVWVAGFQDALGDRVLAHPLSAASRLEMQLPQSLADTVVVEGPDGRSVVTTLSYGMGLRIDDRHGVGRFVCHSGGYPGFGSHMRWHVDSGWALIAFGNRTYANMTRLCSEALVDVVTHAGRTAEPVLWPETEAAMTAVESLANEWDDALADSIVSMNVDLDLPRRLRAEQWRAVRQACGVLRRSHRTIESDSPAHARWQLDGESANATIEIRLSPEKPPRVQSMALTPAP